MRSSANLAVATLPSRLYAARKAATLLLVDDDPLIRRALGAVLHLEGYAVLAAQNGADALELALHTSISMLITDFQMPEMDGYTLATRLTERKPALPVLLISGAAENEIPLQDLGRRGWDFLPKPIDRTHLLRQIDRECLGRRLPPRSAAASGYDRPSTHALKA